MKTKTLSAGSWASNPGGVRLSHDQVRLFHPDLYRRNPLFALLGRPSPLQSFWQTRFEEHLMHGDSRAALVVATRPLLVAAYTDELDCVAVLAYPERLVSELSLEVGKRLLTVNLYQPGQQPVADLERGPGAYDRNCNFSPLIAEFVSSDVERIEARKSEIDEAEWERTRQLAEAYLAKTNGKVRDGNPMNCGSPARWSLATAAAKGKAQVQKGVWFAGVQVSPLMMVVILLGAWGAIGIAMGLNVLWMFGGSRVGFFLAGQGFAALALSTLITAIHIRRHNSDPVKRDAKTRALCISAVVFVASSITEFWVIHSASLPDWLQFILLPTAGLALLAFSKSVYSAMLPRS